MERTWAAVRTYAVANISGNGANGHREAPLSSLFSLP